MRHTIVPLALAAGLFIGACGSAITVDYPNRVVGADGRALDLDDLEVIANDTTLSIEEKRQAFRDLGILDEKLIDALMEL